MEQKQLSTTHHSTQTPPNQDYYHRVDKLYKNTYLTLQNYNPRDEHSIRSIFEIIDTTTELQNSGCEESAIGGFAYKQHLQELRNYKATSFISNNFDLIPLYTSMFFARIAQHKAYIKRNNLTTPTIQEFMQHKKSPYLQAAIQEVLTFGFILNPEDINPNNHSGILEYEKLIDHIGIMLQTNSQTIETVVDKVYGPKL